MAKTNPILAYFERLLNGFLHLNVSINLLLLNIWGTIFGAIAGFILAKRYEAGLLFQNGMNRTFNIMGMQHDVFLRLVFFIAAGAFIGAYIQRTLKGGRS